MAYWETEEAKKAAKVYRSFNIKCRVITCKHYSSYLAIYRDDSDGYSDRCNQARKRVERGGGRWRRVKQGAGEAGAQ